LLHQLPAPHSASVKQTLPQAPLAMLQKGPACAAPGAVQSVSAPHLPQAPLVMQYGIAPSGQALVAATALSPLHAAHVLFARQTGAVPAQSADVLHAAHAPALGPPVTQTGLPAAGQGRVVAAPKFPLHAAQISLLGVVSHVGVVPVQFASLLGAHAPQVCLAVSHTFIAPQSASTSHATHARVAGSHAGVAAGQSAFALHPLKAQNPVTSGAGVDAALPLVGQAAPLSVAQATRTRPTPPLPPAPAHCTEPLPPEALSTVVPSVVVRAEIRIDPPAPPPPPPSQLTGELMVALAPRALTTAPVGALTVGAAMKIAPPPAAPGGEDTPQLPPPPPPPPPKKNDVRSGAPATVPPCPAGVLPWPAVPAVP
jgi:hypothetical protein